MVQGPRRRELVSPSQVGSQLWMEITTTPREGGGSPGPKSSCCVGAGPACARPVPGAPYCQADPS